MNCAHVHKLTEASACSDDIGDHDRWAKYFGCKRILHKEEVRPHILDIETQLQGSGPWNLEGDTIKEGDLDGGIVILHTPGHTSGCVTLWHECALPHLYQYQRQLAVFKSSTVHNNMT